LLSLVLLSLMLLSLMLLGSGPGRNRRPTASVEKTSHRRSFALFAITD